MSASATQTILLVLASDLISVFAALSCLTLDCPLQDTELFYDLKRVLEDSDAHVPPQLAHHEAAKVKPGSIADRPRREQTVYAKS